VIGLSSFIRLFERKNPSFERRDAGKVAAASAGWRPCIGDACSVRLARPMWSCDQNGRVRGPARNGRRRGSRQGVSVATNRLVIPACLANGSARLIRRPEHWQAFPGKMAPEAILAMRSAFELSAI